MSGAHLLDVRNSLHCMRSGHLGVPHLIQRGGGATTTGRVLVVGGKESSAGALRDLAAGGYSCASVDSADALLSLAATLRPEAIVVPDAGPGERDAVSALRRSEAWRGLPVIADLSGRGADALLALGFDFDDRIHTADELTGRAEAALRAKRLI